MDDRGSGAAIYPLSSFPCSIHTKVALDGSNTRRHLMIVVRRRHAGGLIVVVVVVSVAAVMLSSSSLSLSSFFRAFATKTSSADNDDAGGIGEGRRRTVAFPILGHRQVLERRRRELGLSSSGGAVAFHDESR